jgi:hypothetical protein
LNWPEFVRIDVKRLVDNKTAAVAFTLGKHEIVIRFDWFIGFIYATIIVTLCTDLK